MPENQHSPDHFFSADQRNRLTELLARRREGHLSGEQEYELQELIEAELDGARRRAEHLINEASPGKSKQR